VHDAATGKILYSTRLPSSVTGFPITYAVGGRQYLAVPAGNDPSMWSTLSAGFTPEKRRPPAGNFAMYVFALPDASMRR
jgi:alcohol dehydrogenase (cytochrome c)